MHWSDVAIVNKTSTFPTNMFSLYNIDRQREFKINNIVDVNVRNAYTAILFFPIAQVLNKKV